MTHIQHYIQKRALFPKLIEDEISPNTGIIVVIPCYNETGLTSSLQALYDCTPPVCTVEVIVVINSSTATNDDVLKQNGKTLNEAKQWLSGRIEKWIKTYIIYKPDFPAKHAGVGLARKTGMDEAARRFMAISRDKGVICGFDADATCEKNYFVEIERFFYDNTAIEACSIYYQHPTKGTQFDQEIYKRIIQYELYLRYYNQAMRYIKHPHAYHTIGSSFCVRAETYAKQGGMNKRKAGEDFYFLQKIIPLGNYGEIITTAVYPSPRPSDRVPFGTGAAIQKMLCTTDRSYPTYNPEAFFVVKTLFEEIQNSYATENQYQKLEENSKIHQVVKDFLKENDFEIALEGIINNSNSLPTFLGRFYMWFNAFRVLKFLNFAHPSYFSFSPIREAAEAVLSKISEYKATTCSETDLLEYYRAVDRALEV